MKIGELAKRSGLATSRIRFYESSGLIGTVQRQANGYREYSQQALQTLEIITCAQQAGFSLEEIRQLLPDPTQAWPSHDELLLGLKKKVAEIEALQQRLEQNKKHLLMIIDSVENTPQGLACSDNAERLMTKMRNNQ
ncbi:MerR family transcriptional regulator [Dyella silvatica]|uniref:MerR family transcriptional regulator n=1 Tax=Dyella silvatica TaxID=2992128 RepID=UPI002251BC5F|nr:MerR family transcriptional regulator [Dyella silvatica]